MMTDTLADMLTRIRNGNRIERPIVDMPATRLKINVAQVLKDEGFIHDYEVGTIAADKTIQVVESFGAPKVLLRVHLKYGPQGEKVIRHISRASRPGRRLYRRYAQLKPVLDGLGMSVISTSKGVMSDRRAKAQKLGGEILCTVW